MDERIVPSDAEFWTRARRHLLKYGGEFVDFVPANPMLVFGGEVDMPSNANFTSLTRRHQSFGYRVRCEEAGLSRSAACSPVSRAWRLRREASRPEALFSAHG